MNGWARTKAALIFFLALLVGASCSFNEEKRAAEQRIFLQHAHDAREREKSTTTTVIIDSLSIKMTRGHFLLARKGADVCCMRFTNFYVTPDPAQQPGEMPYYYAEYEVYHRNDGRKKFDDGAAKRMRETLGMNPFIGGHGVLRPDPGPTQVRCGAHRFKWTYPTFVLMGTSLDPKRADSEVQLAPTPWTEIREVDASDQRLKWYRYDPNRGTFALRVHELWK